MRNRKEWSDVEANVIITDHHNKQYNFHVKHSGYDYPGVCMTLDPADATPPEFELEADLVAVYDEDENEIVGDDALDLFEAHYDEICEKIAGGE